MTSRVKEKNGAISNYRCVRQSYTKWQAEILPRVIEHIFSKHNYFYGKQTFPTICHKIEVDVYEETEFKELQWLPFTPFSKGGN